MSPPSNRTGFRRDTTTPAHRPGSRRSNGSSGSPRWRGRGGCGSAPSGFTRANVPGKHIALNESHSAFSRDLAPAPGGGEVKHRDQPRMGDESTTCVNRCFKHSVTGARCGGASDASGTSRRERGPGGGPCSRGFRGKRNPVRRNANTNRHSGLCRLPR